MPTGVPKGTVRRDFTNERFGRLVVLRDLPSVRFKRPSGRSDARRMVEVECDCGSKLFETRLHGLTTGNTTSCGCLQKENARKAIWKDDREEMAFKNLLRTYKSGAKNRGYSWELTEEEFRDLTKSDCWYTGRKPSFLLSAPTSPDEGYLYNGIDRLDNTKGYTKENCVACCFPVNKAKNSTPVEEFLSLIKEIVIHKNLLTEQSVNDEHTRRTLRKIR